MAKKFEKLLDRATDSTLLDPHWENILLCVDSVKSGEIQPKQALPLIKKRYRHENPHVKHHVLLLLEALVKNCGEKMHREVATKDFMEDIKHLAEENATNEKVKDKILELIQCWAHAFRNKSEYKIIVDTHNLMKLEGYSFPPLREADAMFDAESAPEWVDAPMCHRCTAEFGLLTRKHHCRNCGQVFCDKCSSRTLPLPHIGIEIDVRVCETCFDTVRNKLMSSSSKQSLSKAAASSELDSKGPASKDNASDENEKKLREDEELQLALAISQSEAEEKERKKQRNVFGLNDIFSSYRPKSEESKENKVLGYTGTQDNSQPLSNNNNINNSENNETEGELEKYLNRGYWEARRSEQKRGILRNSPTPSAPFAPPAECNTSEAVLNGKASEHNYACQNGSPSVDCIAPELTEFMEKLRSNIEVFVNRIRNDVIRGRSIVTDSSVQSMFVNLTTMHTQLLHHMAALDDRRGYFESLQDKLAQIKDAREAIDALREEHAQRRQADFLEMQRQRQMQMATKLDLMRQKKHEMLEEQRLLAMQRVDDQRREMEVRRQMQIQQQQQQQQVAGFTTPNTQLYATPDGSFSNIYQMASTLPAAPQHQQQIFPPYSQSTYQPQAQVNPAVVAPQQQQYQPPMPEVSGGPHSDGLSQTVQPPNVMQNQISEIPAYGINQASYGPIPAPPVPQYVNQPAYSYGVTPVPQYPPAQTAQSPQQTYYYHSQSHPVPQSGQHITNQSYTCAQYPYYPSPAGSASNLGPAQAYNYPVPNYGMAPPPPTNACPPQSSTVHSPQPNQAQEAQLISFD